MQLQRNKVSRCIDWFCVSAPALGPRRPARGASQTRLDIERPGLVIEGRRAAPTVRKRLRGDHLLHACIEMGRRGRWHVYIGRSTTRPAPRTGRFTWLRSQPRHISGRPRFRHRRRRPPETFASGAAGRRPTRLSRRTVAGEVERAVGRDGVDAQIACESIELEQLATVACVRDVGSGAQTRSSISG